MILYQNYHHNYRLGGRRLCKNHPAKCSEEKEQTFNSPLWSFQKPDGSWRLMVDYRELNKIMPPLHASIPLICDLMDQLTTVLGTYHYVVDLANAFFSIAIADESQGQLAFTWEGRQRMFQVLPQGHVHSLTMSLAGCGSLSKM